MNDIKALCDQVRQTSYAIHVYHGHGHLEKVYENALVNRLRKAGLDVKFQIRKFARSDAMHRGMGGLTALFSALFAFFAVK